MPINLFSTDNISELHLDGVDHLIAQYMLLGCQSFITNVDTEINILQYQGMTLPFSINNKEYESSYVCSPFNAFVSYGRDALLSATPKLLKKMLELLINGLASPLKWMRINRCVQVNNRLWSTNLYANNTSLAVTAIRKKLTQSYPNHTLAFRSLTATLNGQLIDSFKADGFILLPSRPICLIDYRCPTLMKKRANKKDRRYFNKTPYQWLKKVDKTDAYHLHDLYQKMFIKQHSVHNPQFTPLFFQTCIEQDALEIKALQDPQSGNLVAMLGLYIEGHILTVPFAGYDTSLDKKAYLYPILNALIAKICEERQLIYHASAGAMDYKRARGGIEEMEYTAIYVNHLPWFRQWGWKILSRLSRAFFKEQTQ
ncbi:GNAT family N-acetyltransferase [uncultured Shewanella sp.]|uniref:GNAT family N-acetyltransferase n=1 Tax=uncultured Shewanella sp. TaxID=173975 RepID=UPI0026394685|nr:GNAT family N-acetyltransferase [uncultured Shewanella sp.]